MTGRDSSTSILTGKKALLADDMQLNQYVMGEMLQHCGLDTVAASNGEEALRLSKEQQFDIILLDVVMPVMDGLEACERIRSLDHPNAKVPIVAMTANVFESELATYKKAGITATLVKPIDQEQLCNFLRSLIDREDKEGGFHPAAHKGVGGSGKKMDLQYLENVSKGNKNFVRTMMESFYVTLDLLIDKLSDAVVKKDNLAISELLHQLQFPLGVVGLIELTEQINSLEKKAKQPENKKEQDALFGQLNELLVTLEDLLNQADCQLKENLSDAGDNAPN